MKHLLGSPRASSSPTIPRAIFCGFSTDTRCDQKYGECLNKKNYYNKRHIAINPPQNTPSRFEHTYPIVLATF